MILAGSVPQALHQAEKYRAIRGESEHIQFSQARQALGELDILLPGVSLPGEDVGFPFRGIETHPEPPVRQGDHVLRGAIHRQGYLRLHIAALGRRGYRAWGLLLAAAGKSGQHQGQKNR